jgi:plasmid stabilization system protein ParE
MRYSVEFSPTADEELEAISDYILDEFGLAAQRKFYKKLAKSLALLSSFPQSCPESEVMEGLRKAVVTEYTIMLFAINGDCVQIAAVLDGRRDYESMEHY